MLKILFLIRTVHTNSFDTYELEMNVIPEGLILIRDDPYEVKMVVYTPESQYDAVILLNEINTTFIDNGDMIAQIIPFLRTE